MKEVAKRGTAMLLLLLTSLSLLAGPVSESEARQKARAFLQEHGKKADALSQNVKSNSRRAAGSSAASYYVFNLGEADGFVIVSGDDRTTAILGYADSGSIDIDDMPDGLRYLLEGYEEQMAMLDDADVAKPVNRTANRSARIDIAPLITTQWNQGAPYNTLCPTIDGERTVTGCVATTMAQILYYHYARNGFAASSTALPEYTAKTKDKDKKSISLDVAGLAATTFDWANMTTTYTTGSTGEAADAVAQLMLYCGTALQMQYGLSANGGSSAYSEAIPFALKTYFGYDGGIQHCYRKNYSYSAWVDMIHNELAASRPVALGGQSCGGGHSFICDGYNFESEADYFHINWGWGGSDDGYFLLSVLNPEDQGIGGSSTLDGFSYSQDAVIGIQKPVADNADYCLSLEGFHLGGDDTSLSIKTFTRGSSEEDFTGINLYFDVWNYHYGSNEYDYAIQLVSGSGNVKKTFYEASNQTMGWNDNNNKKFNDGTLSGLSIPAKVDEDTYLTGTYYIKVMSRPHGESNWQECYDGDAYKLTATISGNNLTIDVPIPANVNPTATFGEVTGDRKTGHEHTVTATIKGGAGRYNGNIFLRVNNEAVMGTILNIGAGETQELQFSFNPLKVGSTTIALYVGSTKLCTADVGNIAFTLDNDQANKSVIEANNGTTTEATLHGRTLYKDGKWNTICLPFDVTLAGSPLAGAEARILSSSSYDNGALTLNFSDPVETIEAGKPYIIKWEKPVNYVAYDPAYPEAMCSDIVNPVFTDVTIQTGYSHVTTDHVDFRGWYSYQEMTSELHSVLFVGSGNRLYWPSEHAILGACRAYFRLNNGLIADDIVSARMAFDIDFTGITTLNIDRRSSDDDGWYTIDGRKLDGQPTRKGLYIHGGHTVVIK